MAAAVLALLPRFETVLVALAAAVDELFAHSVTAVVEPLEKRFAAGASFFGQETELYRKKKNVKKSVRFSPTVDRWRAKRTALHT